ncbi:MAG TPA: hypothetical protein PLQ13_04815 [Candidatus Krumholzibacteria bacterium]|nr:hypothetical protein [Candidatus Krumholzibacteria bacterium]
MHLPLKKAALSALLLLLTVPGLVMAAAPELPVALADRLPNDLDVLAVVADRERLEADWSAIVAQVGKLKDDGESPWPEVASLLDQVPDPWRQAIDRRRPCVLGVRLPDIFAGISARRWLALPVLDSDRDWSMLAAMRGFAGADVADGYVVLSDDADWVAVGGGNRLLAELPVGTVSVAVDMQRLWVRVEPILTMLDQVQALADTSAAGLPGQVERRALFDLLRTSLPSGDVASVALTVEGPDVVLRQVLKVLPGSDLEAPGQPDLAAALELSRALPADAALVGAWAVDLPGYWRLYSTYYRALLAPHFRANDDVRQMLDAMFSGAAQAMAAAATAQVIVDGALVTVTVTKVPDPKAFALAVVYVHAFAAAATPYVTAVPVDDETIEGVFVSGLDYDYDPEHLFAALVAEDSSLVAVDPQLVASLAQAWLPGVRWAVRDGFVYLAWCRDAAVIARMVEQAGRAGCTVHPALERAAAEAGPGCQVVMTGDLGRMLSGVLNTLQGVKPDLPERAALPEAKVTLATAFVGTHCRQEVRLDLAGFGRFVDAIVAFDRGSAGD